MKKYLSYLLMAVSGFLLGFLPPIFAIAAALFGASCVGLHLKALTREVGWDNRSTQMGVAHGLMLFGMALLMLIEPTHADFWMKSLSAATAAAPIYYDGGRLISKLLRF